MQANICESAGVFREMAGGSRGGRVAAVTAAVDDTTANLVPINYYCQLPFCLTKNSFPRACETLNAC